MSELVRADGLRLRRARPGDVDFLASLAVNEDVSPFMAVSSPRDEDAFLEEIERSDES